MLSNSSFLTFPVLGSIFLVMFFLTILRNITQWPCFPWKAHPYAAHYQKFVRYFVGYFLNFVAFCIIVVFSVIVWSNYLPEFEDKESEDYCVKEVYKISVGFLIIAYVTIAGYALFFLYQVRKYRNMHLT